MKKVVLLIWLLAMGYGLLAMGYGLLAMGDGLLAMGDGLWAMGDGLLANDDPYALRQEALRDFDQGKAAEAQKKLIQAHDLFVRAENWDMASMCLYERAIDYMNIGDWANMSQQCEELKSLNEQYPSSMVAYNYHSVASGYYSYVDSIELAIAHGWRAIDALEQIDNPSAYNIVPVWSYYNMAFFYVKECDGTHSECCARRVPHSEEIARHIERRDPRGHAAVWL